MKTSKNEQPTTSTQNKPTVKSKVIKVKPETEEKEAAFVVKRPWAAKAENDEEKVYHAGRRTNNFCTIRDLIGWTKKNVVDFEPGKMFETLLTSEKLFDDPGLREHPQADVFLDRIGERHNAGRKSNSYEVGFRCFARKIFMDVFKDKSYGLVNRNFTNIRSMNHQQLMSSLGKFMDKVLEESELVEDDDEGDARYELSRFRVEAIKDELIPFTTENKAGSHEIEVYT